MDTTYENEGNSSLTEWCHCCYDVLVLRGKLCADCEQSQAASMAYSIEPVTHDGCQVGRKRAKMARVRQVEERGCVTRKQLTRDQVRTYARKARKEGKASKKCVRAMQDLGMVPKAKGATMPWEHGIRQRQPGAPRPQPCQSYTDPSVIEAELLRAGVEPNPGPQKQVRMVECSGRKQAIVYRGSGVTVLCPGCACKIDFVGRGKRLRAIHPKPADLAAFALPAAGKGDDMSAYLPSPGPMPEATSVAKSACTAPAAKPVTVSSDSDTETVGSEWDDGVEELNERLLIDLPNSPTASSQIATPGFENPPTIADISHDGEVRIDLHDPEASDDFVMIDDEPVLYGKNVLDGDRLTESEVFELVERIAPGNLPVKTGTLIAKSQGDHRLVTNRNVDITNIPFRVSRIEYGQPPTPLSEQFFRVAMVFFFTLVTALSDCGRHIEWLDYSGLRYNRHYVYVVWFLSGVVGYVFQYMLEQFLKGHCRCKTIDTYAPKVTLAIAILKAVSLPVPMTVSSLVFITAWVMSETPETRGVLEWLPHVVSVLYEEFCFTHSNEETLRPNLAQRAKRIATFPVIDTHASEWLRSSVLVAEYLILTHEKQGFTTSQQPWAHFQPTVELT